MSVPRSNAEVLAMKRFRLRLSSLLWLVALAAAFLWGIRYGEYLESTRTMRPIIHNITLSPAESAEFESKLKLLRPVKPTPDLKPVPWPEPSGGPRRRDHPVAAIRASWSG
jgi:hypothetical protein